MTYINNSRYPATKPTLEQIERFLKKLTPTDRWKILEPCRIYPEAGIGASKEDIVKLARAIFINCETLDISCQELHDRIRNSNVNNEEAISELSSEIVSNNNNNCNNNLNPYKGLNTLEEDLKIERSNHNASKQEIVKIAGIVGNLNKLVETKECRIKELTAEVSRLREAEKLRQLQSDEELANSIRLKDRIEELENLIKECESENQELKQGHENKDSIIRKLQGEVQLSQSEYRELREAKNNLEVVLSEREELLKDLGVLERLKDQKNQKLKNIEKALEAQIKTNNKAIEVYKILKELDASITECELLLIDPLTSEPLINPVVNSQGESENSPDSQDKGLLNGIVKWVGYQSSQNNVSKARPDYVNLAVIDFLRESSQWKAKGTKILGQLDAPLRNLIHYTQQQNGHFFTSYLQEGDIFLLQKAIQSQKEKLRAIQEVCLPENLLEEIFSCAKNSAPIFAPFLDGIEQAYFTGSTVITPEGQTFARESLMTWLRCKQINPLTGKPLQPNQLRNNLLVDKIIEKMRACHTKLEGLELIGAENF